MHYRLFSTVFIFMAAGMVIADAEFNMHDVQIKLIKKDITKIQVDAIVNAANATLPHYPSGVAGAIWQAAGADQLNAYIEKNISYNNQFIRIPVGNAVVTPSFNLNKHGVQYIIHAVGPNISSGESISLLYDAYVNSLLKAHELKVVSIAFPPISTGIFGGNLQQCARQAVQALNDTLSRVSVKKVYLVYFDDQYAQCLSEALKSFAK